MDWWFSFGRLERFPSNYGEQHSGAHTDTTLASIISALLIIAFSCFAILPAYTSNRRFVALLGYTCTSFFIGGIILGANYCHSWEVGTAEISSQYKPGSPAEVQGTIGLHVALRGINITLKGQIKERNSSHQLLGLTQETVDYNEHFSWEWSQGRFGFGPYAGQISRDFRAAVIRGTPIPILQIAEYFTFDGEGIRFGRHYRQAGYYAQFFLWTACMTWILANVLFFVSVQSGSIFLAMTGVSQLIAALIWTFVRNVIELHIPFESGNWVGEEVKLSTGFGTSYHLVWLNGILCFTLGLGIGLMNFRYADELCQVFGIDSFSLFKEEYHTEEERFERRPRPRKGARNMPQEMQVLRRRENPNSDQSDPIVLRRIKSFVGSRGHRAHHNLSDP